MLVIEVCEYPMAKRMVFEHDGFKHRVMCRPIRFRASIKGFSRICADGCTPEDAVGNLIREYPAYFNIQFQFIYQPLR